MDKRYKHLNGEERGVFWRSIGAGRVFKPSACCWDAAPRRSVGNCFGAVRWAGYRARRKLCGRRRKLAPGGWLHAFVRGKLIHKRWSPEQITRKLKAMHPDDPARLISHETIYAAIYAQPRGGLKAGMIAALRQHKPSRGLRRTTLPGGSITPKSLRILHRPEEIEGRLVPGHRE
jgi:IS30 family transposase